MDMDNSPDETVEPANLRFLRRLVTVLTAVMILGLLTVVGLLVMRLAPSRPAVAVPPAIALPAGATALAVTAGPGWYAVVTTDNRILIFGSDGALRQEVAVTAD